jgi:hypothetical protein
LVILAWGVAFGNQVFKNLTFNVILGIVFGIKTSLRKPTIILIFFVTLEESKIITRRNKKGDTNPFLDVSDRDLIRQKDELIEKAKSVDKQKHKQAIKELHRVMKEIERRFITDF